LGYYVNLCQQLLHASRIGISESVDGHNITPIKIPILAVPAVNTTLLPPHTIYHELAVYSVSAIFDHVSLNDIWGAEDAKDACEKSTDPITINHC